MACLPSWLLEPCITPLTSPVCACHLSGEVTHEKGSDGPGENLGEMTLKMREER